MKLNSIFGQLLVVLFIFALIACNKEDNSSENAKGEVEISITDAPVDDPGIKSTVITVTGLELDGTRFNFDNEVQLDIMAYQRGNTKILFTEEIQAASYSSLALILKAGEKNGHPACFVETKDGVKHDLFTGIGGEVKFNTSTKTIKVMEGSKTSIVLDFNVRNAIRYSTNTGSDKYNFNADFDSIIRAENTSTSKVISGKVADPLSLGGSRIVAYLYVRGEFNKQVETSVSGSNGIMFENALSSDAVDASGNFSFHFIPSQKYEIVLVGYENIDSDSEYEVKGFLTTNILGSLGIEIDALASGNVNTNLTITGFLGI